MRDEGKGVRLRLFGGVELVSREHQPIGEILRQPKQLAVLVYLALSSAPGYRRRDSVVAMFWPELDTDRARAALRKTVHGLRAALGEGVIAARGDEELGLADGALWCDVTAFDAALELGQLARAMELYRGELLGAFFIHGAPDFDLWLEAEREGRAKSAATAAWVMAQRAESEDAVTSAVNWARRAAHLAPLDERLIRKTIAMLARYGDRAGALALYEGFRRKLAVDFAAEPAAETVQLAAQLHRPTLTPPDAGTKQ